MYISSIQESFETQYDELLAQDDGAQLQSDRTRPLAGDEALDTYTSAADTQLDKEDRITQLTARIGDLEGALRSLGSAVQALQTRDDSAVEVSGYVAFHAVSDRNEIPHLGLNQNIIFETVLLNIKNAFHANHGLFIAPTSGLYMFSASLLSYKGRTTSLFAADITKNGEVLARLYGNGVHGKHAQGSATVVAQLKVGDKVCVRLICCPDDSLFGECYSTFSGALIA